MPVKFYIKEYQQLNKDKLYEILQLRAEVFIVEQKCIYQDIDNKDQKALHVLGYKNKKLIAYTRIFKPNEYFELASIGRVVVVQKERKHKYGYQLMETSILAINIHFKEFKIAISAQKHLKQFYNTFGFQQVGEGYMEDGIPHIYMINNK
ncbi:MAG TPA: GNAT family N-acetyltransferase [Flavobacteriaceae bacterium]|jgi:ElaA protein|nr:GNAT family N-acetyltransferase [Flavobacteriaceae bacterium]HBS11773.1 GNAT family N-acetyltransferase [Flavobacteriaceae bacterium]